MSAEPGAAGIRSALKRLGRRAIREPLVQFLAVALVLFGANSLLHGRDARAPGDLVSVSSGRVQQLADSFRLLSGRAPSRSELEALVGDFVDEEIAYREAVAMGLDADDTIVRRRMRQKLEFLVEDADGIEEPTDRELAGWLEAHAARYRVPERISFRQVFASSDARGPAAAHADVSAFLDKLRSGADPDELGDTSMLPAALPLTSAQGIAVLFGDQFARSLFEHTGEGWFGPVPSPFGAHAVLILGREPARDPALDEVRGKLRSDWIEAKRQAAREAFQARLRKRYSIEIDWPEPYAGRQVARDIRPPAHSLDASSGE